MQKVKQVWVIDDDLIFVYGIKKIITLGGYCDYIKVFEDGHVALEEMIRIEKAEDYPQIIFLDINMPVMDGWQFLDALKELPIKYSFTIYVITSSISKADQQKAKEYDSIQKFYVKPVTREMVGEMFIEYIKKLES